MVSAVPSSARNRSRSGSIAVSRKTAQPSTDAHNAADSMPAFASASWLPWKASEAISRDTIKPMPAMAPAPVTAAQPTGGRIRLRLNLASSARQHRPPGHRPPRPPLLTRPPRASKSAVPGARRCSPPQVRCSWPAT